MFINRTYYVAVLLLVLSCSPFEAEVLDEPIKRNSSSPPFTANSPSVSPCFEAKMETWFSTFNELQNQGLSMFEADEKANVIAEKEFDVCEK